MKISNRFIENFYDKRSKKIKQLGILGFLHDKLAGAGYEITRRDVALNLSPKAGYLGIGNKRGDGLRFADNND